MATIAVTTSNIRGNPRQHLLPVRRRIRRAAAFPGINFGQEIDPGTRTLGARRSSRRSYATIWDNQMRAAGKATVGGHSETPISFPVHEWDRIDDAFHVVHGGLAKVSPARGITELDAIHEVTRVRGDFLACHPVSRGYPGARSRATHWTWRNDRLEEYFADLEHLVEAALHRGCAFVVFGGDMNHPTPPRVHADQLQLIGRGLDHLWVVPAPGYRVANIRTATVRRNPAMDHPILHAKFDLRKAS